MDLIRKAKRLSIATQAGILMVLTLAATVAVLATWAMNNAVTAELRHAQTVADMADSFREIASKHGGFYVRRNSSDDVAFVGKYLSEYNSEPSPDGSQFVFHQKNPFLALGDYSDAVQASPAAAKFRITSDNYMNPANSPDLFDLESIKFMREAGVSETWKVVGNRVRYARALVASESCLKCHSTPEAAPAAVHTQYKGIPGNPKGGGYGYAVGDVVGVTSVSVPHMTPGAMLVGQSGWFYLASFVVLSLMVGAYLATLKLVARPLGALSKYAQNIADADHVDDLKSLKVPRFDADEGTSSNELHRESFALKSLHESMWAAMRHIAKTSKKPVV